MKKVAAIALALCLLAGCGPRPARTELTVFAAASLTEALTAIAEDYAAAAPEVELVFCFDASGTLLRQLSEGASCDLFLSAAPSEADALGGDIADRWNLLENRVVLAVPEGNPAHIADFSDLSAALSGGRVLLAMGGPDVPAGRCASQLLSACGLSETALAASGAITYASNVKEIIAQLSEGMVDCGIVYATDARSAGLPVAAEAEGLCDTPVYPVVVLHGEREAEARAFAAYLSGEAARAVFTSFGFLPAS